MVKLLKDQAQRLLIVLAHAVSNGTNYEDVRALLRQNTDSPRIPEDARRTVVDIYYNEDVIRGDLPALLVELAAQLNQTRDHRNAGDLFDQLAEVLKAPYSRNVLDGRTLAQLRKTLLRPDEITPLRQTLAKRELSCPCGHAFGEGEMATCRTDSNGQAAFLCLRCAQPATTACSGCKDGYVPIKPGIIKVLTKGDCGHATREVATDQMQAEIADAFDRTAREIFERRFRVQAGPRNHVEENGA